MRRKELLALMCAMAITVGCGGGTANDDQPDQAAQREAEPDATGTSGDTQSPTAGILGGTNPQDFVEQAAIANMAEIELGQLALKRAQNPQVKKFAQMMIDEHTKALSELKQAASKANYQVPTQLDEEHRDLQQRLSQLQGAEFDREYMNAMVDAHEDTENLLEDRAGNRPAGTSGETGTGTTGTTGTSGTEERAESRALDQWATKTLPKVQQHLEQARQLNEKLENVER